jgi:hypothetical protein
MSVYNILHDFLHVSKVTVRGLAIFGHFFTCKKNEISATGIRKHFNNDIT